jgi:hypothetical protein
MFPIWIVTDYPAPFHDFMTRISRCAISMETDVHKHTPSHSYRKVHWQTKDDNPDRIAMCRIMKLTKTMVSTKIDSMPTEQRQDVKWRHGKCAEPLDIGNHGNPLWSRTCLFEEKSNPKNYCSFKVELKSLHSYLAATLLLGWQWQTEQKVAAHDHERARRVLGKSLISVTYHTKCFPKWTDFRP